MQNRCRFVQHQEWSKTEDSQLLALISKLGTGSWKKISQKMGSKSAHQCEIRYGKELKSGIFVLLDKY
jgi:hypothetical protein